MKCVFPASGGNCFSNTPAPSQLLPLIRYVLYFSFTWRLRCVLFVTLLLRYSGRKQEHRWFVFQLGLDLCPYKMDNHRTVCSATGHESRGCFLSNRCLCHQHQHHQHHRSSCCMCVWARGGWNMTSIVGQSAGGNPIPPSSLSLYSNLSLSVFFLFLFSFTPIDQHND